MKRLILIFVAVIAITQASAADDGVEAFLEGFVAQHSTSDVDFFYVASPKKGKFSDSVWIYWMTGNMLLFVDVPTRRLKEYSDFRAKIRLGSDVVPTADDIQGSNYLAEAKFVEGLLLDCLGGGRKIVLKKVPNHTAEPASPSRGGSS